MVGPGLLEPFHEALILSVAGGSVGILAITWHQRWLIIALATLVYFVAFANLIPTVVFGVAFMLDRNQCI